VANGVLIRGMHIGTLHERLPARRVRDTEREGSKREEYTGGSLTSFITLINANSVPLNATLTPHYPRQFHANQRHCASYTGGEALF